MPAQNTKRYCADPETLRLMQRDGLGWGHDLDCGGVTVATGPGPAHWSNRILSIFRKGQL